MSKPKLICGQCRAKSLYPDEDYINGIWYVACRICGNRWPGGPAPIRVDEDGTVRDAIEAVPPQTINDLKKEGEGMNMGVRKPCENCKRVLSVVEKGRCSVCAKAGRGKSGDELIAALATIKGKIERGEIKRNNLSGRTPGRPRKSSASPSALPNIGTEIVGKIGERLERGVLLEATEQQTIIPVTLRLTVEIAVRVNGIVS